MKHRKSARRLVALALVLVALGRMSASAEGQSGADLKPKAASQPQAASQPTTRLSGLLWEYAGCEDGVHCVTYSPDGQYIAAGSADKTAVLLDAATGRAVKVLRGHTSHVAHVAFSADSRRLATAGMDRVCRVWDVASGDLLAVLKLGGSPLAVSLNHDGSKMAEVHVGMARDNCDVFDVDNEKKLFEIDTPFIERYCAYSADGKTLLVGAGMDNKDETDEKREIFPGHLLVCDGDTGTINRTIEAPCEIKSVGFTTHGLPWYTCRVFKPKIGFQMLLQVLDPKSYAIVHKLNYDNECHAIAVVGDGTLAVGGIGTRLFAWDIKTGATLLDIYGGTPAIWWAALSPDDRYVASAAGGSGPPPVNMELDYWSPRGRNTVRVWDLSRRPPLPQYLRVSNGVPKGSAHHQISARSADGKTVLVNLHGDGFVVDMIKGDFRSLARQIISGGCGISGDGSVAFGINAKITLVDAAKGKTLQEIAIDPQDVGLALSYDGRSLFLCSSNNPGKAAAESHFRQYDSHAGKLVKNFDEAGLFRCMALSRNGRWLLALGDSSIEASDGQPTPGAPGLAVVWDLVSGKRAMRTSFPRSPKAMDLRGGLCISDDGKAAVIRGATVHVWDAGAAGGVGPASAPNDRPELFRLDRQRADVIAADFAPKGGPFITVTADGTAMQWDANTGQLLASGDVPVGGDARITQGYGLYFDDQTPWLVSLFTVETVVRFPLKFRAAD